MPDAGAPDLSWLAAPVDAYALPPRYALLVPGCGPGRDYKRWPVTHYAALADRLRAESIASVAIGTKAESDVIAALRQQAPHVLDLCGQTTLPQLASLARKAVVVVGNDTGPVHLAAAVGAPTLALMPQEVDPGWSAPRGPKARFVQGRPLAALPVNEVFLALRGLLDKNEG